MLPLNLLPYSYCSLCCSVLQCVALCAAACLQLRDKVDTQCVAIQPLWPVLQFVVKMMQCDAACCPVSS